ncbi:MULTISPECIES: hypothetical protein [unclassified Nocardia]|uniref:hypothetical protein n=1 Tax=Nocardia sp. NPDC056064 TaxID=3345701 RepID=UPI0035DAAB4A
MTEYTEPDRAVADRLEPWIARLGADRKAYQHHVLRVLRFADLLFARTGAPGPPPSGREEFVTAATFHDLGIWAAGTFDYLEPSCALAGDWLIAHGREDLSELVCRMIRDHHRIRPAGRAADPVELFRRADLIDVSCGARRFGLSFATYVGVVRQLPDSGFHLKLAELTMRRALIHPLSPLPMIRW